MKKISSTDPILTIITVNYKTSDFISLMLYAFSKLTKNKFKVLICDNYSSEKEIRKIKRVTSYYDNTEVFFRKQSQFGSVGHAEGLDFLLQKVTTPFFVNIDSDATVLLKNWDELLIKKLNKKIKLIGTSVAKSSKKYLDFPQIYLVLYETETFKKLNNSFMPSDLNNPKKDTGFMIRTKYKENNYKGSILETVNTRENNNTIFKNILCSVYFLDSKLIASHFGRGATAGMAKFNSRLIYKIPFFSKFIRKFFGLKDKRAWIKVCRKIIDQNY
jgi:hypothetical protein